MTNEEKYKTPEEREKALCAFCIKHIDSAGSCTKCPAFNNRRTRCSLNWLALEAEEEKPLPCPFCGGKSSTINVLNYAAVAVRCDSCCATSGNYDTVVKAIAAWNRRAK